MTRITLSSLLTEEHLVRFSPADAVVTLLQLQSVVVLSELSLVETPVFVPGDH